MQNSLSKLFQNWLTRKDGHFGMYAALLGMPLILGVGLAVDTTTATREVGNLQTALDAAALAAVIPADFTNAERDEFAKQMFAKNYEGNFPVELTAESTREVVQISGKVSIASPTGKIIGAKDTVIERKSEAILTRGDVVCVLALDQSGERAIEFKDNASFNSPACSVQTNSKSKQALFSSMSKPLVAKSFCSSGGSSGNYKHALKNNCSPIGDPYANLEIPAETGLPVSSHDTVKGTVTLKPGIYPDGLKIDGANVTFEPGIYHIWGELLFTSSSTSKGNDVTLILKGKDGKLKMDNSASVRLKAPATGVSAGLVFWQSPTGKGSTPQSGKTKSATEKSEISASADIELIGTAYFPTQELTITSDKSVKSQSPATSFIAYRLQFAGESFTQVHVDHEKGGIPPLLPRSDEGARLVR